MHIPTSSKVMHELVLILQDCLAHEDGVSTVTTEKPVLTQVDRCERCVNFRCVPAKSLCQTCLDAQELRALLLNLTINTAEIASTTSATRAAVGNFTPVLVGLDARVNVIPRLFFIIPAQKANAWKNPQEYLHGLISTKYYLYFICEHSKSPVQVPIKVKVSKQWVEKVAPVLAASLHILQFSLGTLGVHLSLEDARFQLTVHVVAKMREAVMAMMSIEGPNTNFHHSLHNPGQLHEDDIPELHGDAYELIVEKAAEQRGWRSHMCQVHTHSSPKTKWVTKEIAQDKRHGYIIAH
jgi:hypothetical protein